MYIKIGTAQIRLTTVQKTDFITLILCIKDKIYSLHNNIFVDIVRFIYYLDSQASPNLVTSEQRHQAESVFLEFRNSKNPYQMCREILEKSSSDQVRFEAAGLIKSALIREWSLLSENDISSLREYLLNYLLRKDAPPFLREKLLQVI